MPKKTKVKRGDRFGRMLYGQTLGLTVGVADVIDVHETLKSGNGQRYVLGVRNGEPYFDHRDALLSVLAQGFERIEDEE